MSEGDVCEREVVMSGKVYHDAVTDAELPAVGDWVALELSVMRMRENDSCPLASADVFSRVSFPVKVPKSK